MDAPKNMGRSALATPAAHNTTIPGNSSANDPAAQAPRDAAAVFIGNGLRSLRRVVALRLQGAAPAKALHEARRARDAVDSVVWALEYDAGLRARGEV